MEVLFPDQVFPPDQALLPDSALFQDQASLPDQLNAVDAIGREDQADPPGLSMLPGLMCRVRGASSSGDAGRRRRGLASFGRCRRLRLDRPSLRPLVLARLMAEQPAPGPCPRGLTRKTSRHAQPMAPLAATSRTTAGTDGVPDSCSPWLLVASSPHASRATTAVGRVARLVPATRVQMPPRVM